MKFHELAVGEKFKMNNLEYQKIPEVKLSCCKIKENAQSSSDGSKIVVKPLDEVERIAQN
jgi:hypothetical protein